MPVPELNPEDILQPVSTSEQRNTAPDSELLASGTTAPVLQPLPPVSDEVSGFEKFDLNRQLLNALADLGFNEPTPIQNLAIPLVASGHDVLGIAQTGTGKTAAYLLPLLMKVKFAQGQNPRALIIAPTRELAMQIDVQISELAKYTDIRHAAVYGGLGPKTQKSLIAAGLDILVATPGRLMELYLGEHLILKELKTLVIDEADKMMDMGFMPQIRKLLEVIPRKRQNLLFSATMPEKVTRLSDEFLEFPTRVEASPQATPVETVAQLVYEVPNLKTKLNLLLHLLSDSDEFQRVFLFVKTRIHADSVSKFLDRKIKGNVRVIHANKGQNARINSVEAFREGGVRVLVATDVAARGLDISGVSHVINFDVPVVYEDYVHRIGRTGRARNEGKAVTFVHMADEFHLGKIETMIRMQVPREPIPEGVLIEKTPFDEEQAMLRAIDDRKKKDDPTFQGAFHEKKNKNIHALRPASTTRGYNPAGKPEPTGRKPEQQKSAKPAKPARNNFPGAKAAGKGRGAAGRRRP